MFNFSVARCCCPEDPDPDPDPEVCVAETLCLDDSVDTSTCYLTFNGTEYAMTEMVQGAGGTYELCAYGTIYSIDRDFEAGTNSQRIAYIYDGGDVTAVVRVWCVEDQDACLINVQGSCWTVPEEDCAIWNAGRWAGTDGEFAFDSSSHTFANVYAWSENDPLPCGTDPPTVSVEWTA